MATILFSFVPFLKLSVPVDWFLVSWGHMWWREVFFLLADELILFGVVESVEWLMCLAVGAVPHMRVSRRA